MWTGLSQLARQGFQFIVIAVLARLLFPEDFGVIAIAVFFMALIGRVGLGIRFSIIQRMDISQLQLSTLFWTGIVIGGLLWGICSAAAPLAAVFMDNDLVRPVLIVLSAGLLIDSFGFVHGALLNKGLEFKKLAVVEIIGALTGGGFSIAFALADLGVWSLVWGSLISGGVSTILLWMISPWRPSFQFSIRSLRDISGFGIAVVANSVVNFVGMEADKLLIGRVLGFGALGLFSQASRVTQLPRLQLVQVVTRVTFPAFSQIQDDDSRLRRGYLKSASYVALVTFPLLAGLAIVAPEFVRVIFGGRWTDMIVPLQILTVAGLVASIGTMVGSIAFPKGRADLLLKLNLVKVPLFAIAILIGAEYGLTGVSIATSVFFTVEVLIVQWFVNRLIELRMLDWLNSLAPAALGTIGMVAVLLVLRLLEAELFDVPDVPLLIGLVLMGVGSYISTLLVARNKELKEIFQICVSLLAPYLGTMRSRMSRKHVSAVTAEGDHKEDSDIN